MTDLHSTRAKINRAKQKLDPLNDAIRAYLDEEPCVVVPEPDPDTGLLVLVARVGRPPDEDWWLDVGEIGYQARSALDHLTRQIATHDLLAAGLPVPERPRTQFPIFLSEDDYLKGGKKSWRERMLVGISEDHRKIIDALQPYHRGFVAQDPLAILRALSDRDKHRDRHVALAGTPRYSIHVGPNPMSGPTGTGMTVDGSGQPMPVQDGQIIAGGATFKSGATGQTTYYEPTLESFPVTVAFVGDQPIDFNSIARVLAHVEGIIDDFEQRIT